jgi:hypothetical protein
MVEFTVHIDNVREKETKGGLKYLNFNMLVQFGEKEVLYVLGMQLIRGIINPPSFRAGRRYAPIVYQTAPLASAVYAAVKRELERNWPNYLLQDEAMATDGLKMTVADFVRLYPTQTEGEKA